MDSPFTNYNFEVDREADEVIVEAWDDETPADTFRARLVLSELEPLLRRLHRALRRT